VRLNGLGPGTVRQWVDFANQVENSDMEELKEEDIGQEDVDEEDMDIDMDMEE
jgi:hypothetical protein